MFGGGGLDPSKMQQMMKQMGIEAEDIEATEVVIRTDDTELVFDAPAVTKMNAQGQETYQVLGSPTEQALEAAASATTVPDEDVETVANRAGVSEAAARSALEEHDGDLVAAVASLE